MGVSETSGTSETSGKSETGGRRAMHDEREMRDGRLFEILGSGFSELRALNFASRFSRKSSESCVNTEIRFTRYGSAEIRYRKVL